MSYAKGFQRLVHRARCISYSQRRKIDGRDINYGQVAKGSPTPTKGLYLGALPPPEGKINLSGSDAVQHFAFDQHML